jgi:hypothetical protein
MSDADIRRDAERLHNQFKKYASTVPMVQSVWIRQGRQSDSFVARALAARSKLRRPHFYLAHR